MAPHNIVANCLLCSQLRQAVPIHGAPVPVAFALSLCRQCAP
jgi:hypothetical protein